MTQSIGNRGINMHKTKGRFTLPGESGYEKLTLETAIAKAIFKAEGECK